MRDRAPARRGLRRGGCCSRSRVLLPRRARNADRGELRMHVVVALLQLPAEDASACGREAVVENRTNEVVPKTKADPLDAQDPPLAEPLELLRELGDVQLEHGGKRLGLEGRCKERRAEENAVCPASLAPELGE